MVIATPVGTTYTRRTEGRMLLKSCNARFPLGRGSCSDEIDLYCVFDDDGMAGVVDWKEDRERDDLEGLKMVS